MKNQNTTPEFNTVKDAVHHYIDLGWKVFPLETGLKKPKQEGYQKLEITHETIEKYFAPGDNVAVFLGPESNDLVDIDLDSPSAIIAGKIMLPPTKAVFGRKGARSSHYFYRCQKPGKAKSFERAKEKDQKPECNTGTKKPKNTILEVRSSEGGRKQFTSLPPNYLSEHDETVEWEGPCEPAEADFDELMNISQKCAAASYIGEKWPHTGSRHGAALALSGYLLAGGIGLEDAEVIMKAVCAVAGDEETDDRLRCLRDTQVKMNQVEELVARGKLKELFGEDVVKKVDEWLQITPPSSKRAAMSSISPEIPSTELACAEQFVEQHQHEIRYDADNQRWWFFNGKHWEVDSSQAVKTRACQFTQNLLKDALEEPNPTLRSSRERIARSLQNNARINGILALASTYPCISVKSKDLDTHRHLLNCQNGILDLLSNQFTNHNPDLLITRMTHSSYNPSASAPRFQEFLNRIFQEDNELIEFVQKVLSFGLIGENPKQHMYILHGQGANGKSVLMNVVTNVIGGDYVKHLSHNTLLVNQSSNGARPDLTRLDGVRLAVAPEMNSQMQLDEAIIKTLTGGDRLSARSLYVGYSEFRPELSIFLHTNHMPVIKDNGFGIWRRMVVIPFDVSIPSKEQDANLSNDLMEESEGILAWLVEGYQKFQNDGLDFPKAVEEKLGSYRKSMDPIGYFLEKRTESVKGATTGASTLYDVYRQWSRNLDFPEVSIKEFKSSLEHRGYEWKKGRTGNIWVGMKLLEDDADDSDAEESGEEVCVEIEICCR